MKNRRNFFTGMKIIPRSLRLKSIIFLLAISLLSGIIDFRSVERLRENSLQTYSNSTANLLPEISLLQDIRFYASRMREEILSITVLIISGSTYEEIRSEKEELQEYYELLDENLSQISLIDLHFSEELEPQANALISEFYLGDWEKFENIEQFTYSDLLEQKDYLEAFETSTDQILSQALEEKNTELQDFYSQMYNQFVDYSQKTLIWLIASNILLILAFIIFTKKPFEQIKLLRRSFQNVLEGNIHTRVDLVTRNNEVSDLAGHFNEVAESLEKAQKDLQVELGERIRAEEKLKFDAFHDTLTGLANRALLFDHLEQAIERYKRDHSRLFSVIFIDLDRFKLVNDSLGHNIGDLLLEKIARRFEKYLRQVDTIARVGGDEFVILVSDIEEIQQAIYVAERIMRIFDEAFDLDGHEVQIGCSVGIVMSTEAHKTPEDYFKNADIAMYRAKMMGKGRFEVYDPVMHKNVLQRLGLENSLRAAWKNREFEVYYQPVVDLETAVISGFEALLRWKPPSGEDILPEVFIPIMEENGMIIEVGEWVLRSSVAQLEKWQQSLKNKSRLSISVNIAGIQLLQADFKQKIEEILDQHPGVDPGRINLEITERSLIRETDLVQMVLLDIKKLGLNIYMDDFGTGYSSLGYLRRFPIDVIKVDRSFVTKLSENNFNDFSMVNTIVSMGKALGLQVVAEGIETHLQLDTVRELDCQYGQGFYFSEAQPASEIEEMLQGKMKGKIGKTEKQGQGRK